MLMAVNLELERAKFLFFSSTLPPPPPPPPPSRAPLNRM